MKRKYTNRCYRDAARDQVLIFDGAMGTNFQALTFTAEHFGGDRYQACFHYLVISYSQAVEQVHRSFLEIGVDVVQTNSFRANCIPLSEYGFHGRVVEINAAAGVLARRLAD